MLKALLKYLLCLGILLLGVYGYLSAHTYQQSTFFSPVKIFAGVEHGGIAGIQKLHNFHLKATLLDVANGHDKIAPSETEAEDDEFVTLQNNFESSYFLSAVFYAGALAFLLRYLQQILHTCKQIAFFSYHRWYLLFRVFRI